MNALNLKKSYMDNLTILDSIIEYLDDNGDRTGMKSYALVYVDNENDNDVLAEPYSLEHDLAGNVNVRYYNRELPQSYVIV